MIGQDAAAVGIDGCRAGWIAAVAYEDPDRQCRTALCLFKTIEALVRWREQQVTDPVVAIDVPMGLPAVVGLRACDTQARTRLGRRWMWVFEVADRELFGHSFESARAIVHTRRARDPQATFHVLQQQGAHILNKIAEVDAVLLEDRNRQSWLIEVHPEVCFRKLAQQDLPRKKSAAGKNARRELLRQCFPDIEERIAHVRWSRREVGYDDLLDAYVALWSALRFARGPGCFIQLGDGQRDNQGLLQRIIV
jgi:predicted RNase H-like nuclease